MLCVFTTKAQEKIIQDTIPYFYLQPMVGYTTFALGDVKDFYDAVLNEFKIYGLVVPTQKEYPGNVTFGLNLLYNIPSIVRVGLGSQYTWTEAYSGYEDYAGLLEVNSKITLFTIEGVVERDIESFKAGKFYGGARGGISFVNSDYSNTVSFTEYPGEVEEIKLSGDGNGFTLEGYLGVNYSLGNVSLGVTTGYRLAKVKEIDGKITIPGEGSYSGKLNLEHDMSGIVVNAKVSFRFSAR